MSAQQCVVYKGDTFRNLVRRYSRDRMQRDTTYKHSVEQILEDRRKKKSEAK